MTGPADLGGHTRSHVIACRQVVSSSLLTLGHGGVWGEDVSFVSIGLLQTADKVWSENVCVTVASIEAGRGGGKANFDPLYCIIQL